MDLTLLEIIGFIVTLISVWLVIRERRSGWIWSALSALLYIIIYWKAGLYSDAELQLMYIGVSIYGYINWSHHDDRRAPEIKMISLSAFSLYILLTIVLGVLWGTIHSRTTDASLPYADALLASTCIIAQWMMARKYFQCWYLWLFAGIGYVWMYAAKELSTTMILYVILFCITLYGYKQWKNILSVTLINKTA
jgi:nicotinamide mononucleotide transporter